MKFTLAPFVAFRYIGSRREQRFISFISLTSWLGLILGVAAMIVVLSVMNGFTRELQSRILQVIPHGYIEWSEDRLDWEYVLRKMLNQKGIEGAAPLIDGKVLLMTDRKMFAVDLQGVSIDLEEEVSDIHEHMLTGRFEGLENGTFNIILGYQLAQSLKVGTGDTVKVLLPDFVVSPAGVFPRQKKFTVVGISRVGASPDATLAVTDLSSAAKLLRKAKNDGSPLIQKLRLKTADIQQADTIIRKAAESISEPSVVVHTWRDENRALFKAIKMERRVVTLLLFAIIAVAVFNIASILVMMVSEKRKDIAILQVMGLEAKKVPYIFICQGLFIGVLGVVGGVLVGSLIAVNMGGISSGIEAILHSGLFNTSTYYFVRLPSDYQVADALYVALVTLFLCVVAAAYPAWQASKIDPISSLND